MDPTTMNPADGERMLAAILFTDVVEYSKMSGQNEERTVMVVRRDLNLMSEICKKFGGQVLKNTGDGLLMSFTSAVQAMQCALEIQQVLYEESNGLPAQEVVRHRMGLNLGDVIVTPNDVHGDGVNVAARLMAEAKPGAITFSRTVHDVVKGKVPMHPAYLGPRHLKHILEPVMVWQISPLGDEQKVAQLTAETAENLLSDLKPPAEAKGTNAAVRLVAAMILIAAIPVLLFFFLKTNTDNIQPDKDKSKVAGKSSAEPNKENDKEKDKGSTAAIDPQKGSTQANSGTTGSATAPPVAQTADALRAQLLADSATSTEFKGLLDEYRFADLVAFLRTKGYTQSPAGERLAERYDSLAAFLDWLMAGLRTVPQDNPLVLNLDGQESRVFGGLKFLVNNQVVDTQLKDHAPGLVAAIAKALDERLAQNGQTQDTRLSQWLRDFNLETQDHRAPGTAGQ